MFNNNIITIKVKIEDINDNYPRFSQEFYHIVIKEDEPIDSSIIKILALDNDSTDSLSSLIHYSINSGNDANYFKINKLSGIISVNDNLDCDLKPTTHNLTIMACDSDPVNRLCSITRVQIQLEDVNDNFPKFPVFEYFEFIYENEPIDTKIFVAQAIDYDHGINSILNYSIIPTIINGLPSDNDSWKLFSVSTETGIITTKHIFDYEYRNQYSFILCASDVEGYTTTVQVNIGIDSKDEFYPQFTKRIYNFNINISSGIIYDSVVGFVSATDKDKGPDGRIFYQLSKRNRFFKVNRTTGALIFKQKEMINIENSENFYKLVVSASSGRQNSLSNVTIVEISIINENKKYHHNLTTYTKSHGNYSNLFFTNENTLSSHVLSLFCILLLLLTVLGVIFFYLYVKNQSNMITAVKPAYNSDNNMTSSPTYVDSSAFDSNSTRNITGRIVHRNSLSVNFANSGSLHCHYTPPKYDEITSYNISRECHTLDSLELSTSEKSGSSGRGSAEDDGDDEEIRMINEIPQIRDSMSDLSVSNTQEYLARLGIIDPPTITLSRPSEIYSLDNLQLFEDQTVNEDNNSTLMFGKSSVKSRSVSDLEKSGGLSMHGSLSSIVHSEEELTGSYNWDYLLEWGPQYQPLAHVFHEIAALKDETLSAQKKNSTTKGRKNSINNILLPSLLTSVTPKTFIVSTISQIDSPRIQIERNDSTFSSIALSPSFTPSLSPLATRSPSVSPLVPTNTARNHCSDRGISICDTEHHI